MDNFFNPNQVDSTTFNESPSKITSRTTNNNSGSVTTLQIDEARQGVEITTQKYFDAGMVKISSGERGHRISRIGLGFIDGTLDKISYSEPIVREELFIDDGIDEQGILEPLTIRNIVRFRMNEKPVFHSIKAGLCTGNDDTMTANDFVSSTFNVQETHEFVPFFDERDQNEFVQLTFVGDSAQSLDPFVDFRSMENDEHIDVALTDFISTNRTMVEREQLVACGWMDPEGSTSVNYLEMMY